MQSQCQQQEERQQDDLQRQWHAVKNQQEDQHGEPDREIYQGRRALLESGMISRGKYTFVIRLALLTRLVPTRLILPEKYCHGTSVANEKSA